MLLASPKHEVFWRRFAPFCSSERDALIRLSELKSRRHENLAREGPLAAQEEVYGTTV
jgi:hypothetical protein